MRKETIGNAVLYLGDCLEVLPAIAPFNGVVITDPVYPRLDYGWEYVPIERFGFQCRQFYFWMLPPEPFPLPFTAMHVWSKANVYIGDCELWEPLYEVNGHKVASVLRESAINSGMAAQMNGDRFYDHPCQKPIKLMRRIVKRTDGIVLDPFMGSGSTGQACADLSRGFIGIERDPKYFDMACERIENAQRQTRMFA